MAVDADRDRRRAPLRLRGWLTAVWRPVLRTARTLLRNALITFVVLTVTLWLLPGVRSADVVDTLWLVVLVAAVGGVARLLLLAAVRIVGGLTVMVLGAGTQLGVMAIALRLDPADRVTGLPATVVAAVMAVVLAALLNWFIDAGTDTAFVAELRRLMIRTRRARLRRRPAAPAGREPGVLIVQLDGVSAPLLDWAVRAGNLPTIGGWLRSGSHVMSRWHTGLPATTPAAQAGILHGDDRAVPAYRWYDKDRARIVVASRPRDAAEVEAELSNGAGLLRDGGVSISNVFSGDAPVSLLTVSRAAFPGRSARGWAVFMASPYGLTRAIVLGLAEMVTELHQARLQRRRNVQPRVSRRGAFLALRPAAMLLRDVNVSLVAEQMARGAAVVYCDLVDYDEVAHHAGPARPEALKALEHLDHTLGTLQRLAGAYALRDYHLVVLSDHGQSLGATFRHRHGRTLDDVVAGLAGGMLVLTSGNLALLYAVDRPGKATRADLEASKPGLVEGLVAHPGVGLVVVDDHDGPVALGRGGRHRLRDGVVEGADPLAPYGPRARGDLLRHQLARHVGDLVVIGAVDAATDEVAAFEELVGSHGGLGGAQTAGVLVYPADWPRDTDELDGPVAVHHQLLSWLRRAGLRRSAQELAAEGGTQRGEDPDRTVRVSST
ncbi:alkaline phosphatase family protein [Dactylosporangium sp. AC04546]|uniref:alkaline phosphatase family protein n=1 Tax=Dactylosporangium sp. AC04546 TaxID=2862460 RepID=UPI001EDE3E1A|nr:alkaline phosphatase family protein [Dactylosporangium sp. AC04546]WVK79450.1 alkaline phosphatase family protein [Dactylosporangium sp. AC04546]